MNRGEGRAALCAARRRGTGALPGSGSQRTSNAWRFSLSLNRTRLARWTRMSAVALVCLFQSFVLADSFTDRGNLILDWVNSDWPNVGQYDGPHRIGRTGFWYVEGRLLRNQVNSTTWTILSRCHLQCGRHAGCQRCQRRFLRLAGHGLLPALESFDAPVPEGSVLHRIHHHAQLQEGRDGEPAVDVGHRLPPGLRNLGHGDGDAVFRREPDQERRRRSLGPLLADVSDGLGGAEQLHRAQRHALLRLFPRAGALAGGFVHGSRIEEPRQHDVGLGDGQRGALLAQRPCLHHLLARPGERDREPL